MTDEKKSKISAKQAKAIANQNTEKVSNVGGSLASKIQEVPIDSLRVGDKVLYPGNRVIPVESISLFKPYHQLNGGFGEDKLGIDKLYVVTFVGQPANSPVIAFRDDAKIFIYAG